MKRFKQTTHESLVSPIYSPTLYRRTLPQHT